MAVWMVETLVGMLGCLQAADSALQMGRSMDEMRAERLVEWTGQLKVDSTVDSWDVQMEG